jgi:hypothetical protein
MSFRLAMFLDAIIIVINCEEMTEKITDYCISALMITNFAIASNLIKKIEKTTNLITFLKKE